MKKILLVVTAIVALAGSNVRADTAEENTAKLYTLLSEINGLMLKYSKDNNLAFRNAYNRGNTLKNACGWGNDDDKKFESKLPKPATLPTDARKPGYDKPATIAANRKSSACTNQLKPESNEAALKDARVLAKGGSIEKPLAPLSTKSSSRPQTEAEKRKAAQEKAGTNTGGLPKPNNTPDPKKIRENNQQKVKEHTPEP